MLKRVWKQALKAFGVFGLTGLFLIPALPASAGWLSICNRGSADLSFAVAQGYRGLFSSIRQSVEGFYAIPAGACEDFFEEANTIYALAFVAQASDGRWAPVEFSFRADNRWNGAAQAVCGPLIDAGAAGFSYMANSSMRGLGTACRGATPMVYPVSGTFQFGDNDGVVNVQVSQSEADQRAATFYADRDPEAAARAAEARREEEALQLRLALQAARLAAEARARAEAEEAARLQREEDLATAIQERLNANAVAEIPEIELKFSLYSCPQSASRAAVFHLYYPNGAGGFRHDAVVHMPGLRTSSGHRKRYSIPRDEDGEPVVYWYVEIADGIHPSDDPTPVPIWGDTQVSVPGVGDLDLHRLVLTPNVLGTLSAHCDPQRLLKAQARVQALFSTEDPAALSEFSADVVVAGGEDVLLSNHIFSNVLGWQFDPLTGTDRRDVLAALKDWPDLAMTDDTVDVWVLRAFAPYLGDHELLYVFRPSRTRPLALPVIRATANTSAALLPLDGTNENLYIGLFRSRGNAAVPLTDETARLYIRHFFTLVEGGAGRMLPVQSVDDIAPFLSADQRREAEAAFAACHARSVAGVQAAIALPHMFHFKGALVCSTVTIDGQGIVGLADQSIVMEGVKPNRTSVEIIPKRAKN